jgi:hypothetical protein
MIKLASAFTDHCTVVVMLDNKPVLFAFDNKAEALDFLDMKKAEGFVFVYLWCYDGDTYQPLDAEIVRKNLEREGIWL